MAGNGVLPQMPVDTLKSMSRARGVAAEIIIGRHYEEARSARAAIHAVEARGESYGDVRQNHERIAALWSVVFGKAVTPEQVVLAMTCVRWHG